MGSRVLDFHLVDPQTVSVFSDANDGDSKKSGTCGLTITVPVFICLAKFGVCMVL